MSIAEANLPHPNWAHLNRSLALLAVPLLIGCAPAVNGPTKGDSAPTELATARALAEHGEFGKARISFEAAIAEFTQKYGRTSDNVAQALVELSACLYNQQLYSRAEPVLKEALEIEDKLPSPNLAVRATAYNNLAEIYKRRGDEAHAEEFYNKAIAVYTGDRQKKTAMRGLVETYCNLAMLYKREDRFDLARKTTDLALAAQKKLGPNDVLAMSSILNTQASIERAEFNNESAKAHYQEAVAMLRKNISGPPQIEEALCDTMDNLADLLMDEHDNETAEADYLESIQHCTQARGPKHPCVAERMVDLANLYKRTGKAAAAEGLLVKALAINTVAFNAESPIVVNTINDLSSVYLEEKKYEAADALYSGWLPRLTKELGPNHPRIADALENWALVATRSEKKKEADDLRARAKAIRLALTKPTQERAVQSDGGELSLQPHKRQ